MVCSSFLNTAVVIVCSPCPVRSDAEGIFPVLGVTILALPFILAYCLMFFKVSHYSPRHPVRMIAVDDFSADWIRIKAEAEHKTPAEIIGEMVRERIAASL